MKAFYNKLHDTFDLPANKQKFTDKQLPVVKLIDLYAGQDYNEKAFETHLFPALFVKWQIDYKDKPAIATITIRLCYEQMRDTSNLSRTKEPALKFIDFIAEVDKLIKSIETEHTGKLVLLSEDLNIEDTIVDTYTLVYLCSYTGKENTLKDCYLKGTVDDIVTTSELYSRLL